MNLSKRSIETLLDLVEIKISYMDVQDREDARELQTLERCRDELRAIDGGHSAQVMAFQAPVRRRVGRPPRVALSA